MLEQFRLVSSTILYLLARTGAIQILQDIQLTTIATSTIDMNEKQRSNQLKSFFLLFEVNNVSEAMQLIE